MKILSTIEDKKLNSLNILTEITVSGYVDLIKEVLANNEFQRKRVKSSKSVYTLLKTDLLEGCVIPPIVLALTNSTEYQKDADKNSFINLIQDNNTHLVILDGLQRTLNIIDLIEPDDETSIANEVEHFLESILRVEIYIGITRMGILYRMLTLNTGQTPMSLRQQIEMLYIDYSQDQIPGITLIRESENLSIDSHSTYSFKDMIEGYMSFIERNPLPIERSRLLEDIGNLEKFAEKNITSDKDQFEQFVITFNQFLKKLDELFGDTDISGERISDLPVPASSTTAIKIFKKNIAISAFGAAIGQLIDKKMINDFSDVANFIEKLETPDLKDCLISMNSKLLHIKNTAPKIGTAQRKYFVWFYRELFNVNSDSHLSLTKAVESGFDQYDSLT